MEQSVNATILIVSTKVPVRDLMKEILELHGNSVVIAKSAKDTLELLRDSSIDLVILEGGTCAPKMLSLDLLPQIKEVSEEIPVVFVTATWNPRYRESASKAGMDKVLFAPINTRSFPKEIADLIR